MSQVLPQLLANGLYAGSLYALVGLGFVLEYRVSRAFNFAYAGFIAIGAYGCWWVLEIFGKRSSERLGSALFFAVVIGVALAAVGGWLADQSIFRILRRRGATPLVSLLASLGLFSVLQNLISLIAGDNTKVIRTGGGMHSFPSLGPVRLTMVQVGVIATSLLVGLIMALALRRSSWGQRLRAVANDPDLALVLGLPVNRVHASVRSLGSGLAGMAGIWIALDTDLTPLMGFRLLILVSAAMVIGGLGSLSGVVLGGMLLGMVQNLGVLYFATEWQDCVAFTLLVLFLLFRPQGLLGKFG